MPPDIARGIQRRQRVARFVELRAQMTLQRFSRIHVRKLLWDCYITR